MEILRNTLIYGKQVTFTKEHQFWTTGEIKLTSDQENMKLQELLFSVCKQYRETNFLIGVRKASKSYCKVVLLYTFGSREYPVNNNLNLICTLEKFVQKKKSLCQQELFSIYTDK